MMEVTLTSSFHLLVLPKPNLPSRSNKTTWKKRTTTQKIVSSSSSSEEDIATELRVCTNRSCSRQGSRSILAVLSAIAPPSVSASSCGCLGRCGSGPNLVLDLPGGPAIVTCCATPARAARLLAELCRHGRFDPEKALKALAVRNEAEDEIDKGNFSEAQLLLSQAIELRPSGGLHFLYRLRSVARLAIGDNEGALHDAEEAFRIAPKFPEAFICQGDAFVAMEQWDAAEKAYSNALLIDPSIRRSRSFKARVAKLEEKLIANASS